MFPWRNDVEKRLHALEGGAPQQRGLSEVEQLRRQVAELQAALRSGQGTPAPAPIGQIEKHYYYGTPKQEFQIPDSPKQQFQIPDRPKQEFQIPDKPKQEFQIPDKPKQQFQLPDKPKQEFKIPDDPTPAKPMPPPPTGLQRFTAGPPIITPSWNSAPSQNRPPLIHAVITPWKGN